MSETTTPPEPSHESPRTDRSILWISYILSLLGLHIISLIIAYIKRGEAVDQVDSTHFRNIINVFWLGVAGFIVAWIATIALTITVIGGIVAWVPPFALAAWYYYRIIKGMLRLQEERAYS